MLATAASVLLPRSALAVSNQHINNVAGLVGRENINWSEFQNQMTALAEAGANRSMSQEKIAENGMQYLKRLDITSAEFKAAVDDSYETGNRYWLWQRLIKGVNINGGILNIDNDQLVALHDHPGATGMLRIISGEAEVWQFDSDTQEKNSGDAVELVRVSHRILKVGDMAVLNPEKGNIHALRAISGKCAMLDFFIPPYRRNERHWYEPLDAGWFDKEKVACRKIPQHAYEKA